MLSDGEIAESVDIQVEAFVDTGVRRKSPAELVCMARPGLS